MKNLFYLYLDLSLYEVHRKPHEVVTDDSLIGVSPRALHSELMCPICLDLMKNAQTTKEVSIVIIIIIIIVITSSIL